MAVVTKSEARRLLARREKMRSAVMSANTPMRQLRARRYRLRALFLLVRLRRSTPMSAMSRPISMRLTCVYSSKLSSMVVLVYGSRGEMLRGCCVSVCNVCKGSINCVRVWV